MQTFFLNEPMTWVIWLLFWSMVAVVIHNRTVILDWMEDILGDDEYDDSP